MSGTFARRGEEYGRVAGGREEWKREGIPALKDYFIYHGTKLKKPCEQEGICRVLRS
jgi:hypothetical protein